ncbi:MAG: class I SAM-dependent methyltransferase [Dysgonamonadaceae bacterium]|nr:class I SAM-dependent methyltransferase [Dysgonamonadaceae bacterium]MDD3356770.1 class I SAM-dependent methyltransferase [Dysgonamonadaceae bacterium]MDD3727966.1 class I SAM-dependent methyltransferase [Dysgonamonadaceae bacterium]MDD4246486.1 class I SAM-dependent methyltransferase [Dysgonamonadaceae bacterium]MDD4606187.1 class I SAM-dependent methyltransferase [Dysgonamonadaceae bacterium]
MKISTNLFKLIQRKRHSAGFGVHSPFAFDLILNTIHTPHSFYIYKENRRKIKNAKLEKEADIKYAELLFRLINRFNAKDILEIGSGFGINTLYISAHSKKTTVWSVEKDDEKMEIARRLLKNNSRNIQFSKKLPTDKQGFDATVWDLQLHPDNWEEILKTLPKNIRTEGFVVINHINKNKQNKAVWEELLKIDRITMSFDLRSIGIGFFKPSLPKLNYEISF